MLTGRDHELQLLARLMAGARVGQSGVLVLTGEAGIGKTALLDTAALQARDMSVLRVSGCPGETGIAFGGLLQLLRPALGLLPALPRPQARAIEVALALRDDGVDNRFAIGAATLSLLSRFGEDRPVLVIIDDMHELDVPSAEAIVFAARRLLADRVAVLIAQRPSVAGAVVRAGLPLHRVEGLDVAAATRLLSDATTTVLSVDQITRLYRATEGNPLALLQLAEDPRAIERSSPGAPIHVPETLARAFADRLERLSDAARTAMLAIALVDGDLTFAGKVCAALRTDIGAVVEAEALGLVAVAPGKVTFRHPLVRSAIYAVADPAARRQMHRVVAQMLPADDIERRAWNLAEATVGPDPDVADLLATVGDRQRQRGAYADAATAYERSATLMVADMSRRHLEVLIAGGETAWLAGQPARANALLERAVAQDAPVALQARICGLRATIAARTGFLPDAMVLLTEGASAAEITDPDTAVILLADAVRTAFFGADAHVGLAIANRVEALLPRVRTARARIIGRLAIGIAHVVAGTGGIQTLRAGVADLAASTRSDEDPASAVWLVLGPLFLRESGTGRALVQQAVEDRRASAALGSLPFLLFHLARDDETRARWQEAEIGYQEGARLARESGQTTDLAMCLAGLAWLQAKMGRADDCRATAAEAGDLCAHQGIRLGSAWVGIAAAVLELGLGRAAQTVEKCASANALLHDLDVDDVDLSPDPELVEALVHLGRLPEAGSVASEYCRRARIKNQPWAIARAERALGVASSADAFDAHFARAVASHRMTDDAFELARTHLAYGSRLRRTRRKIEARHELGAALRTFERLGARPWADICAGELTATGVTVARRGAGSGDLLTPQESQIAMMLGPGGRTTKQAAAALFLSPKTVEYHLRHIYTKLAIRSREELRTAVLGVRAGPEVKQSAAGP